MVQILVQPATPATQDFRDGAATGASIMAKRIWTLLSYGLEIDRATVDKLAYTIAAEYGGGAHDAS